jgi:hypothetical protein
VATYEWQLKIYVHTLVGIFINSSFCVLKLMLPAGKRDFAEVARTTEKVERAYFRMPNENK